MLLTVLRHRELREEAGAMIHVVVNGQNVTERCVSSDDEYGWALCYRLNAEGRKYIDSERDAPATELLIGDVVYTYEREPATC